MAGMHGLLRAAAWVAPAGGAIEAAGSAGWSGGEIPAVVSKMEIPHRGEAPHSGRPPVAAQRDWQLESQYAQGLAENELITEIFWRCPRA